MRTQLSHLNPTGNARDMYRFPTEEATETQIAFYATRHFAEYNTYRNHNLERIVRNIYYEQGRQWVEPDRPILLEGTRGYAFRTMENEEGGEERPMPVTNFITNAVDVEFATLAKRQWTPKIPQLSRDPRLAAAAKVANDVLNDRLKRLHWPDLRDRGTRNFIVQGTVVFKSFWDESWSDVSWYAVAAPHWCPACASLFSSPMVPKGVASILEQGRDVQFGDFLPDEPEDVELDNCPRCANAKLEKFVLDDETSRGMDTFGRPLGKELPRGNTNIELVNPFEYYPENGGIGITPQTTKIHGICKVRSIDWIEDHLPEIASEVQPEPADDLMRWHPTLGEWNFVGRFDHALDAGIYDNHARVFELIHEPSGRFPNGRYVVTVGKTQQLLAKNCDLMVRIESEQGEAAVARVAVAAAQWKEREGEFWARGLPDDLVSPQNRVNGIDSQVIEARERMGSPNLMVPTDADLQGPEYRAGYGLGKLFRYEPSITNPASKPEVFGSVLMPSGVHNERAQCVQDMTRIIGPADIEIGEAPRNVTTTSGLQILGEQAERRRGTRERSLSSAFQKVWEHQLQLLWTLRVDEDSYEAETPDGTWELKTYDRMAIAGQTKVEIEKQAYIDKSITIREGVREGIVDKLYDISNPLSRKRALDHMGLPNDINEDENLQIEHAKRAWVDFVDERKIPVIDPSIDNPTLIFQVLGAFLKEDEGIRIAEEACWPHILPVIAGWEEELQQLVANDAKTRAVYGGEPEELVAAETYARLTMAYQQAKEGYDQQQLLMEQQSQMTGVPPQMGPPPEEPPPPIFFPRQPEKRVYLTWQGMMKRKTDWMSYVEEKASKRMKPIEEQLQIVDEFLRFRAVVDAYRLMQIQPMPAPGSVPGPPGMSMPVGPESPQPGAGLGPPPPGMAAPAPQAPGQPPSPPSPAMGA